MLIVSDWKGFTNTPKPQNQSAVPFPCRRELNIQRLDSLHFLSIFARAGAGRLPFPQLCLQQSHTKNGLTSWTGGKSRTEWTARAGLEDERTGWKVDLKTPDIVERDAGGRGALRTRMFLQQWAVSSRPDKTKQEPSITNLHIYPPPPHTHTQGRAGSS